MPLISVIMPVYNAEKTIQKTIESVLQQTLTDLEIIVINDGSTDRTWDIVSSFQDERLQLHTFPNAGPQKSRNRGIELAQGQYLAFLDADDLWTPDKLEDQLQALQAHPAAALAYSWTDWIDEEDTVWRRGAHVAVSGQVTGRLLLNDFIGNGSNPLVVAEALQTVGGFDEAILGGQDWEMWLRIACHYPLVAVPKVQVLYRKSLTSSAWSNNVKRQEQGYRQVVEKTINTCPEILLPLRRKVLGNLYKSLTVDALERATNTQTAVLALRFISQAVYYDPTLLRARVLYKALLRGILLILLPLKQYQLMVKKLGYWSRVDTLYGYFQLS